MRDLLPYFDDLVRILVGSLPATKVAEQPILDERDNFVGGLAFALRYQDQSELHVIVWADCSGDWPVWTDYSSQYQDRDGNLRFRWDSARHHATLANFPHHFHLSTGGVVPEDPPTIGIIVERIRSYLTEH